MPLKRISKICVVGLSLLLLASGCSLPWSTTSQPDPTAEALFEEGMDHLKNKRYARAIDRLQKVKTEFPFSPQLVSAELKLAEAYYLNKQYPEAVSAFKEFQALHPTNENIPFVVYHLGLAHFDQFTSVDRDQKVTEIAKGYFENVAKSYPNSPFARPANEKVAKCREYLAEHEFYIASFYMRENKYPAARDRLERILRTYPDTPTAVKGLYEIGESYRLEKNSVKAALAYEALLQHYPESPFSKEARVQLAAVEKEKQDPLKMLLMREGRPASVPPLESTQLSSARTQQKREELNLIAKKEVVYEEPGQQRGIFRRVLDTLNPFSSSDSKDNGAQRTEGERDLASKEQSDGVRTSSFWKSLNPFAAKDRQEVKAAPDPQLVGKVDDSLKEKGIPNDPQSLASKAPTPDLTKVEEEEKPLAANPSALLGDIDVALEKRGKDVNDPPPVPEIHPALKAPMAEGAKPTAPKVETAPSQSDSALISNIDEALKKRGIESGNMETVAPSPQQTRKVQESDRQPSTASSQRKIELDTKLTPEKGPLLLESGELQTPESPVQADQEKSKAPAEEPGSAKEVPKSVVKGPALAPKDPPAETSPASERKSPEEEEENKGVFDQLREDVGKLRGLLNPFGW